MINMLIGFMNSGEGALILIGLFIIALLHIFIGNGNDLED